MSMQGYYLGYLCYNLQIKDNFYEKAMRKKNTFFIIYFEQI